MRFIGATSPVITFTKCHDLKENVMYYDLFINGKFDGRYLFKECIRRVEEVLYEL